MKKSIICFLYGVWLLLVALFALHRIMMHPWLYYKNDFSLYSKDQIKKVVIHMKDEYAEQCRWNTKTISYIRDELTMHECESIRKVFDTIVQWNPTQSDYEYANFTISRFYYGAYNPNLPWMWNSIKLTNYWAAVGTFLLYIGLALVILIGIHFGVYKILYKSNN